MNDQVEKLWRGFIINDLCDKLYKLPAVVIQVAYHFKFFFVHINGDGLSF